MSGPKGRALERNKVGIVGLGPVGSILGAYLVRSGLKVFGVELDTTRSEQVNRYGFQIRGFAELEEKPQGCLSSLAELSEVDDLAVVFICTKTWALPDLLPVFADLLGTDESGYGYLLSAGGLGSVIGTLLIGTFQESRRLGLIMLSGAAGSVLMLFGFAWATSLASFPMALLLVFLAAASASAFMIISMTVLQLVVPDALRGRVMGIHTIGYSLVPLGGLFLGALADSIGAGWAVIAGGVIYLIAIGITGTSQPAIRGLDGSALHTETGSGEDQGTQPAATR